MRAVLNHAPDDIAFEVLLLQNGDGAAPPAVDDERVTIVQSRINLGFGGGCNFAASKARGEYLLFLNDDTEVRAGWLQSLLAAAEQDSGVASVGSVLVDGGNRVEEAGRVLWGDGVSSAVGSRLPYTEDLWPDVIEVDHCSACSLLVRRSAFSAVGGFDERYYPAYYEDADLGMQFRRRGWRNLCATRSVVQHERSASTDVVWRRFLGLHNHERFVAKWRTDLALFAARPGDEPSSKQVQASARHAGSRTRALYHQPAMSGEDVGGPGDAGAGRNDVAEDASLLRAELEHARMELRLKDEYIAYLQSILPQLERAQQRLLTEERRRAQRRALVKRLPVIGGLLASVVRRFRRTQST